MNRVGKTPRCEVCRNFRHKPGVCVKCRGDLQCELCGRVGRLNFTDASGAWRCATGKRCQWLRDNRTASERLEADPVVKLGEKVHVLGRRPYDYLAMHTVEPDGCWYFTGPRTPEGYGRAGHHKQAHRYYYTELVGPIPKGLTIDHLCEVTYCVNPEHLEPVTRAENTRRARAKHVNRTHCKHGHELTEENSYYPPGAVGRECRTCRRLNSAARKKRLREMRLAA